MDATTATTVRELRPETMTALVLGMGAPGEVLVDGTMGGGVLSPPEMVSWAAGVVAQAHATLARVAQVIAAAKQVNPTSYAGYGWQCHPTVSALAPALEQAFASVLAASSGAAYAAHAVAYGPGGCSAARAHADQAAALAHGIYAAGCGTLDAQVAGSSSGWGLQWASGQSGGVYCLDDGALACVIAQVDAASRAVEHAAGAIAACRPEHVTRGVPVPRQLAGLMGAEDPGGGGYQEGGGGVNVDQPGAGGGTGGTPAPAPVVVVQPASSNAGWWLAGAVLLALLAGGAWYLWGR